MLPSSVPDRPRRVLAVLAVASLVALAGCGGGGTTSTAAPTPSPTPDTTTATPTPTATQTPAGPTVTLSDRTHNLSRLFHTTKLIQIGNFTRNVTTLVRVGDNGSSQHVSSQINGSQVFQQGVVDGRGYRAFTDAETVWVKVGDDVESRAYARNATAVNLTLQYMDPLKVLSLQQTGWRAAGNATIQGETFPRLRLSGTDIVDADRFPRFASIDRAVATAAISRMLIFRYVQLQLAGTTPDGQEIRMEITVVYRDVGSTAVPRPAWATNGTATTSTTASGG